METSLSKEKLEEEIAKRVREILKLLGEDPNREGLVETPHRVARAFLEMTSALRNSQPELKVFNLEANGTEYEQDQIVLASDIQFSSLCEHHLLPFVGKIHVAYVIGEEKKVAGFSKIIRIVNYYASKPQIQERLVSEIADAIMNSDLQPRGVMVIGDAIHMCSYVRGVKDKEARLLSVASRGLFKTNRSLRNNVFRMLEISNKRGFRLA
ncbi:MAG: GTP cyclohydrolase I [Metallosphaera sp.]